MSGEETVDVAAIRERVMCSRCSSAPETVAEMDRRQLLDALDVRTRERNEARDTLARVEALHVRCADIDCTDEPEGNWCHGCDLDWPCPTVKALGDGRGQGWATTCPAPKWMPSPTKCWAPTGTPPGALPLTPEDVAAPERIWAAVMAEVERADRRWWRWYRRPR